MKLNLSEIVIDEKIYPRSKVNDYTVQRMIEAHKSGARFPPITVESGTHRLIDGRHRYEMHDRLQLKSISVTEKSYTSEAEAFADAVRLNIAHGEPLDQYSVRSAVARLIELGFERGAISEIVRVPVEKIETITKGFANTSAGEPIALKGGLRHMRGTQLSARQMEVNRSYAGGKPYFYAKQLADLLSADMWPRDSEAFAREMARLISLWSSIESDAKPQEAVA